MLQLVKKNASLHFLFCIFSNSPPTTHAFLYTLRFTVSIQRSGGMVDELLAHGASVLGALGDQKERLKGAQHKVLDLLNTIGVSASLLRVIDRRCAAFNTLKKSNGVFHISSCFKKSLDIYFTSRYDDDALCAGSAWMLFWCTVEWHSP